MRQTLLFFWEVIKIVLLALLIVIPIRYFIFQPFIVKGSSMEPNFQQGDYLIVDEISYRFKQPQRGEVIVFRYPQDPSQRFIKRIIGLPGETVKIINGKIIISSEGKEEQFLDESAYLSRQSYFDNITIRLNKNEYFVLGDNRPASFDSRKWGPLPSNYIIGRVALRIWLPDVMARISTPSY